MGASMRAGTQVARESSGPDYGIYAYTAREWNPEIGLYYYRARYYDPKVGRFISEDPIGLSDGLNSYSYVRSSPLTFVDPWGLSRGGVPLPPGLPCPRFPPWRVRCHPRLLGYQGPDAAGYCTVIQLQSDCRRGGYKWPCDDLSAEIRQRRLPDDNTWPPSMPPPVPDFPIPSNTCPRKKPCQE